ncbi:sugar kinase [Gulosibacter sp. ACHW.36C]|uniref:Sugar kinase n=1 Tax=Gulosibacter sediminis TaxID=1729695 RepID=A0ABY4MW50_9MICO|nr:sugar kinase [Gulosibacter sediminis]UQN14661.1 sugar kinase [Gulosibacter sediminis]
MTADVFCYGEALTVVAPSPPAPIETRPTCSLGPAGAEFNVAANLATLGVAVQWLGALGEDPFGQIILDEAAFRGVGVDHVHVDDRLSTGVYFKSVEPSGSRVYYYRDGSAFSAANVRDLVGDAPSPRILHTTGITPALSPKARDSTNAVLDREVAGDALISFDVNYRASLWQDIETAAATLLECAQRADVVFVGRDEAELVWGTRTAESIRALLPGPRHLVVKDGDVIATEFIGQRRVDCHPPRVRVTEQVGAGDAFAAGWIAGYLENRGPVERLRFGHLLAAQALQHPGDLVPLPPLDVIHDAVMRDPASWSVTLTGTDPR